MSRQILLVEARDRHGEHAHNDDLCDHDDYTLYPRDRFVYDIKFGDTTFAQVELEYVEQGRLRLIINQPDYLLERYKKELADEARG